LKRIIDQPHARFVMLAQRPESRENLRADRAQAYRAVKVVKVGQPGDIRRRALVVAIELTWLTDGDERAARVALVRAEASHRT
jgi:hypothetical protein